MKNYSFKMLLDDRGITPYRLSKMINYNMSSMYKLYQGETDIMKINLWVAKRLADVLFNGDMNMFVKVVNDYEFFTIEEKDI